MAEEDMEMKFADGSAFLNHHFVRLGWLNSWLELIPVGKQQTIFSALEVTLNNYAASAGGLSLTVPMLFVEGQKT
jgi:arsenite methyltransferase